MFDYSNLRLKIIEVFGTYAEFAKALGKTKAYVSRYMQGHSIFSQDTILLWAKSLHIDNNEIGCYFFVPKELTNE